MAQEGCVFTERLQRGEERQLAGKEGLLQALQKQPAEETRQDFDRKEEAWPAADPTCAIRRDTPTRNDAMQVGMMQQILTPCMEYRKETDLGP
jgi:hypothetical protein